MARIRTIKPEAFQSESLAAVSLAAERTMFGLSTQADDRGRHPDKPLSINGAIWPERPDHTAAQLESELQELEREGILCRYVGCDGRRYVHFVTWDRHQKIERPSRSRYPRCPKHPVSVNGNAEDCGVHARNHEADPCPTSPPSPNPHRALTEGSGSPQALFSAGSESGDGANGRSVGAESTEANKPRSADVSVNPHRALTEYAETDLGPWTVDLGPWTVDLPSSASPQTARTDDEPTPQQRAFGIARGWIDRRKAGNTPVVAGARSDPLHILRKLIEPFLVGGYTDDEVKHALVAVGEGIPSKSKLEKALAQRRTSGKADPATRTADARRRGRHTNYAAMVADLQGGQP